MGEKKSDSQIGDKLKDALGRLIDRTSEAVGLTYPAPTPEPELNTLLKYTERDGEYYKVPKFSTNANGQTVVGSYLRMSHKQFNRFIYGKNIEILLRKKQPFELAVAKYNLEISKIKAKNASSVRRAETHDDERKALQARIDIMLANWDLEYRNRRSTNQAKEARARISALQRNLAQMKPQEIGAYLNGTFTRYSFDKEELVETSNEYAKNGGQLSLKPKEEQWVGNGEDLVKFYEREIEYLEDHYLEDMKERIATNQSYLNI